MLSQTPELIFFSLNRKNVLAFYQYVKSTGVENHPKSVFRLISESKQDPIYFDSVQDLFFTLEKTSVQIISNLIIIIDIYSIDQDQMFNVKEMIILYPEIKIVFLDINNSNEWINFLNINQEIEIRRNESEEIKDKSKVICPVINPDIHSFFISKENFILLINGKNNLLDSSNLRNNLKQEFQKKLKMSSNFPNNQISRAKNFAICIDEEEKLAYFNSYALYSNGYRSIPITSFVEFNYIKLNEYDSAYKPTLIIRDYDLQFEDLDSHGETEIYQLRGLKYNNESSKWNRETKYWDCNVDIYFITRFEHSKEKRSPEVKLSFNYKDKIGIDLSKDQKSAYLRGISKPINGMYSIHKFNKVNQVYITAKETDLPFNTSRDDGGHSIPPFTSHIAESLLDRSKKYLKDGMYLYSAVTAREALEILNGFHLMMMLDCIYILTLAETSLEISVLGVDDEEIAFYARKRFKDIIKLVKRLTHENDKARLNVLSQIFNDVRHLYLDKELYKSADAALNEFVNIRHGIRLDIELNKKKVIRKK